MLYIRMEMPRRADLARLDRKRNQRKSNQDWNRLGW